MDDTWDQNMILDGDVLVIFLDFPWGIWKCAWQQNMVLPSIVKFKCQAIVKFQCRDQLAQWGNAIGAGWGGPFKKCSNLLDYVYRLPTCEQGDRNAIYDIAMYNNSYTRKE